LISLTFRDRIDRKRKNNLEKSNCTFFSDNEEVKVISAIEYAWYIGTQLMVPSLDNEELNKIVAGYQRMK